MVLCRVLCNVVQFSFETDSCCGNGNKLVVAWAFPVTTLELLAQLLGKALGPAALGHTSQLCQQLQCGTRAQATTNTCVPVYQVSKSGTLTQPSYRHKHVSLPEPIYKLVNVVFTLEWHCVPVYRVSKSGTLTQPSYRHKQALLPEAICCCLQTCKCGFDIRVVLCTSVPSFIVRNANTTKLEAYYTLVYKFYCLRLFVVVYKLVNVVLTLEWYCVPLYQVSCQER